jgi:hypothetical protein
MEALFMDNLDYIELTRDMTFRETVGRYTNLIKGAYGVLVTDESRDDIFEDVPEALVEKYSNLFDDFTKEGKYAAVVAGYPLGLRDGDFIKLENPPKMTQVHGIIV